MLDKFSVLPMEMPGVRMISLFRSDPRLEINTLGRGFCLQNGVVSGLGAGRVGFLAYHSPGRVPCTLFERKQAEGLIQSPPKTFPY